MKHKKLAMFLVVSSLLLWPLLAWSAQIVDDLSFIPLPFVEVIFGERGLQSAFSVAISSDGKYIYVAGRGDSTISVFQRDGTSGKLSLVEVEQQGQNDLTDSGDTVDGLLQPRSVAISPDGQHLYAACSGSHTLAVFARDAAHGTLSFVEVETDDEDDLTDPGGTVDGLYSAQFVAVSPDNKHVYVAGQGDDAVAVFERDTTSGKLSFVEVEKDGQDDPTDPGGTVDGLDGATSVTLSPDGNHLYAAGVVDDAVAVFERDSTSGKLSFVEMEKDGQDDPTDPGGTVDGLAWARGSLVSAGGEHFYATGQDDGAVAVFDRDATTGKLSFVEFEQVGVDDPTDPGGKVTGLFGAYSVAISSDGKHLYAASLTDGAVVVFDRDGSSGKLSYVETELDNDPDPFNPNPPDGLAGAASVALSPDGQHVYAAGSDDDAVALFERDGTTGKLNYVEMQKAGQMGGVVGLNGAASVAVSPDGKHVYVAGEKDHAVVAFTRDITTSKLSYLETEWDFIDDPTDPGGQVDGMDGASSVVVSPDGKHVYVASDNDDAVAAFERDAASGKLSFVEAEFDGQDDPSDSGGEVDGLDKAESVAISPDGKHVYAAGEDDDAVAAFERDSTTGKLNFVEVEINGQDDPTDAGGPVDGLLRTSSVTVSPDGKHVYVTSWLGDAVAAFERDATSGKLNFVEAEKDGQDDPTDPGGPVDGLNGAMSVKGSPDGKHLYVAGWGDSAVAAFERDATSGKLSFVEMEKNGQDDPTDAGGTVDGLSGAFAVDVSPDGQRVYVASLYGDAVAVFERDAATGKLSFVTFHKDHENGVNGLDRANAVAVSPDGRSYYVTGEDDDAVVVFGERPDAAYSVYLPLVYRNR